MTSDFDATLSHFNRTFKKSKSPDVTWLAKQSLEGSIFSGMELSHLPGLSRFKLFRWV